MGERKDKVGLAGEKDTERIALKVFYGEFVFSDLWFINKNIGQGTNICLLYTSGDAYLGGDFFFPSSGKPDCVSFLEKLKMPMREVVVRHLLVSCLLYTSRCV